MLYSELKLNEAISNGVIISSPPPPFLGKVNFRGIVLIGRIECLNRIECLAGVSAKWSNNVSPSLFFGMVNVRGIVIFAGMSFSRSN